MNLLQSESKIQSEIFKWYWNNYCLPIHNPRQMIFHVPNQKQIGLNNIGLYPGVSDLVIIHNGNVFMIEVKEPEHGKQSENQKKFESHCIQSLISYAIVFSLEEFKNIIFAL